MNGRRSLRILRPTTRIVPFKPHPFFENLNPFAVNAQDRVAPGRAFKSALTLDRTSPSLQVGDERWGGFRPKEGTPGEFQVNRTGVARQSFAHFIARGPVSNRPNCGWRFRVPACVGPIVRHAQGNPSRFIDLERKLEAGFKIPPPSPGWTFSQ
jgi:hypothetical protein